ncbi:tetratricopeptide repeat protein [Anaeromyxobacter oryzae]|uniref:Tetratricopeptide repeat protein n=1 Tax=Anaeromyxobacter oryzae TaxID=2918170 RepID=A0ABM7WTF7_9BACT|nr:tetratricopeptide repeat protein [Anaeromyxobacter oryzae]BDG02760.1 hypothetical protein AMOR_17560 [Anaeromyxobacter oryzae]
MASILEKYEQILAADPRSRIFVELAKALLERGEPTRAIDVCRQGLEHHPTSILGRVIWGRALLESADPGGATAQFDAAFALDPGSPYAYNLVAEALLAKGLHREALPVLRKAVALQPADARVKGWLEDARRKLGEVDPADEDERTETTRRIPASGATALASAEADAERTAEFPVPVPGVAGRNGAKGNEVARDASANGATKTNGTAGANGAAKENGAASTNWTASASGAANGAAKANGAAHPNGAAGAESKGDAEASPAPPRPPPIRADAAPHLPPRDEIPRSLLSMLPGTKTAIPAPGAGSGVLGAAEPDAAEAERIAAQYELEVRQRLAAAPEPPPPPLRRHRRLVLAVAAVLAVGGAAGVYLAIDARRAADLAANAAAKARAGIARDTRGSLSEAVALLADARRRAPHAPEILSLSAQANALFAADHGDASARAVATELAGSDAAGDGALAARWLLAETAETRRAAAAAILAAPPSSEPLLQALAGRILLDRGEAEAARGRLGIAARANEAGPRDAAAWPPLLRAVADLGDLALAAGDAEQALALHGAALRVQPTHPRAVVGAAEARLALGRDLAVARRELAAVDADPASAPPRDLRARYEIVTARVLAATGDAARAAERLSRAAQALGESAPVATALAELHLAARAWDRAEAAAAHAVALAPKDVDAKVLLARARIGRGRFVESLAATDGVDGRAVRIQRAIARYRLGQLGLARAELERTARDGRMPAEAAVWYALTDLGQGRADRARGLLEKLTATRNPPPGAHVALGRVLEAQGRPADAERAYRAAVERDPSSPEPNVALGALLLARGDVPAALSPLEKAVAADPADLDARRALGAARLAAGAPSAARADLDAVLLGRPADRDALRLVSAAWLAEGQPAEARRAAERGLAAAPRDPALLVAAARAALATDDRGTAKALADRALKAGAHGPDAADARRIAAETGKRKR